MTSVNSISLAELGKKAQIKETVLMLSAAVVFPFLVHLIPAMNNVPMGAILLPAFIAPFIAVYFFKLHVGLLASILGPTLNYIFTGSPKLEMLPVYTLELVAFTLIVSFLLNQGKIKLFSAPLAFVIAKCFSSLLSMIPSLNMHYNTSLTQGLVNAIPGIVILFVLNLAFVKLNNKH